MPLTIPECPVTTTEMGLLRMVWGTSNLKQLVSSKDGVNLEKVDPVECKKE